MPKLSGVGGLGRLIRLNEIVVLVLPVTLMPMSLPPVIVLSSTVTLLAPNRSTAVDALAAGFAGRVDPKLLPTMVLPVIVPEAPTPEPIVSVLVHCTPFCPIENGTGDGGPMVLIDTFIVMLPDANMP